MYPMGTDWGITDYPLDKCLGTHGIYLSKMKKAMSHLDLHCFVTVDLRFFLLNCHLMIPAFILYKIIYMYFENA